MNRERHQLLPTLLSPVISTLLSVGAIFFTSFGARRELRRLADDAVFRRNRRLPKSANRCFSGIAVFGEVLQRRAQFSFEGFFQKIIRAGASGVHCGAERCVPGNHHHFGCWRDFFQLFQRFRCCRCPAVAHRGTASTVSARQRPPASSNAFTGFKHLQRFHAIAQNQPQNERRIFFFVINDRRSDFSC